MIPARYPLRETPSSAYPQRTEWNVRDADGTLILHRGAMGGGTALTLRLAARMGKPVLAVDLAKPWEPAAVRAWLEREAIAVLNVAGPRESERPGVAAQATRFLTEILRPGQ